MDIWTLASFNIKHFQNITKDDYIDVCTLSKEKLNTHYNVNDDDF